MASFQEKWEKPPWIKRQVDRPFRPLVSGTWACEHCGAPHENPMCNRCRVCRAPRDIAMPKPKPWQPE
eukprot:4072639-Alexandrium_andersonii.AAC.1